MGSLYRNKYAPEGMTYQEARATGQLREAGPWWVRYRARGRIIRESTETENKTEAGRVLKLREGAAAAGRPITPRGDKLTIAALAEDLRTEYKANERRSATRLETSLDRLLPFFGQARAVDVMMADVNAYIASRQDAGAANGTINRELSALRRLYSLAVRGEKIHRAPKIIALAEDNVRQGFFEREQFEAVRRHLPADLRPLVTVAYITGWRVPSELLTLTWGQVDLRAGTLRLEPGSTKNREGRTFYMTPELRATLEAQRAATDDVQRCKGAIIPRVFHRNGKPIRSLYGAWESACTAAGCPGRLLHDFRRTAIRNLERAGVSRSAAMKMTGHKTEAVYRRYAIVDEATLRDASAKLARLDESKVLSKVVDLSSAARV
jgi:integrase